MKRDSDNTRTARGEASPGAPRHRLSLAGIVDALFGARGKRAPERPEAPAGFQETDVEALLGGLVGGYRRAAAGDAKQVDLQLEGPIPTVRLDRAAIEKVVDHLVREAIDRSAAGGQVTILARLAPWGKRVEIAVAADGEACAVAGLERVFGLERVVALRHGGTLAVEARPGAGVRFVVTLPLGGPGREAA